MPHRELGLIDGINLAFKEFFDHFWHELGQSFCRIAFGAFASVVTWIVTSRTGRRPHRFDAADAAEARRPVRSVKAF